MPPHKSKQRIRWHSVFLWHRYMGLTAAAFVVILALTGLMLNHTETLNLDSRTVKSNILLGWYGFAAPENPIGFTVADHWVSQLGQQLYFDDQEIPGITGNLIGVVKLNDTIVIALQGQLLLTTLSGQHIERIGNSDGVPAAMQAIGVDDSARLLVRAAHGIYQTDSDLLEWQEIATSAIAWSKPAEIPTTLYQRLVTIYRGTGLSVERVILDIHSGRILGPWGIYLMDAAAISFILLAAAGIWIWAKRNH